MINDATIRDLRYSDLQDVACVHLAAFPKSALSQLGKEAVKRYYQWQLQGPHDAVALGAFREENLGGFCFAGNFKGALSGFLQKNSAFLIRRIITHPWLVASPLFRERLMTGGTVLMRRPAPVVPGSGVPPKSFGILSIAVDPKWQGAGVGRRLMLEIEKAALERDFFNMHLTVAIDNMQAVRFYEQMNWQKVLKSDGTWHGSMAKQLKESQFL